MWVAAALSHLILLRTLFEFCVEFSYGHKIHFDLNLVVNVFLFAAYFSPTIILWLVVILLTFNNDPFAYQFAGATADGRSGSPFAGSVIRSDAAHLLTLGIFTHMISPYLKVFISQ
jgi:hypothetical protein